MIKKITLLFCLLCGTLVVSGQSRWVDAQQLYIGGHGPWRSHDPYERLPRELKDTLRAGLWGLGTHSSGIYVRFSTNSTTVSARWKLKGNSSMDHMTSVGIKGVDLYWLNPKSDKWQYVQTGRPYGLENTRQLVAHMAPETREFMLYLPLYEGVSSVEVGVDSLAQIEQGAVVDSRPMLFYGTSIMQGACASRPGMNSTSILSRRLGRTAINLGFSGNALLDYELAETMIRVADPAVFVLDFMPNCGAELIESNMAKFIGILRAVHPKTPIVLVEQSWFPSAELDLKGAEVRDAKNASFRRIFNELKAAGDRNLYLVGGRDLMGTDWEAWVDGLHGTDIGFERYAETLYPVLRQLIR